MTCLVSGARGGSAALALVVALGSALACRRIALSDANAQGRPATGTDASRGSGAARADAGAGTTAVPGSWTEVRPGLSYRTGGALADGNTPLAWVVVRLDLERVTPGALRAPGDRLESLAPDVHVAFAVDAGFFEEDLRPSGLLISAGRELGFAAPQGGSGTLVVREHRAVLVDAAAPLPRAPRIDLAVQCGPRLVERDGGAGIHRDDGARFARTAACIRDHGRTLDFIATWSVANPMRGPGLYQFSRMLTAPSPVGDAAGCEMALNLDGGPSTGVLVRGAGAPRHDPLGPVPWAITVRD